MDSVLTWSNALKWFQNYLGERIHCVKKFDGNSLLDNQCWVDSASQGNSLGPLLFLIYSSKLYTDRLLVQYAS